MLGLEITQHMIDYIKLIWERITQAQDCQKNYTHQRKQELAFSMDDKVFVKVALIDML